MIWRKPVFDRVRADVDNALKQIKEWREQTVQGQSPEIVELKGCLNVSDLIRIEGNIEYLADFLNDLHFPINAPVKTDWVMTDIPTAEDVNRILGNVMEIRTKYYPSYGVEAPQNMLTYEDINKVELNLLRLQEMIYSMILGYKRCNTFNSGSTFFLPLVSGSPWGALEHLTWGDLETETWESLTIFTRGR